MLRWKRQEGNPLDVLLLDIELWKMTGIEAGSFIRNRLEDRRLQIVYISGKASYAWSLFKTQPLDFLVKPIRQEQVDEVKANLTITGDVDGSAAKADLVIEAIIEKLEVKRELFGRISKLCKPDTVLATNSSNIVSSKLADVTEHPERLMNIHYFNPALVMELVELVRGPHTGDEAVELARAFAINTGKSPIVLNKEIAGFVANRINAAVAHEALSLLEKGIASVEDIDTACEKGLNYPMGPFRLMDLTGIDVNYYVRVDRYAESHDPFDAPNPLVIEKFKKGEFGKKTGKGWYDYTQKK